MKFLYTIFLIIFTYQVMMPQSITISGTASLDIGEGADVCAGSFGNISGTVTGDGTQCGSSLSSGSEDNYCLQFTGSSYIAINSNFGCGVSNTTIEGWVYLYSASAKGTFFRLGYQDHGFGIGVGNGSFDSDGNELIVLIDMVRWISTGVNIGTGWHHVAFSVGNSYEVTIYLDGKEVYTEESGSQPVDPGSWTYIGSGNATSRKLTYGKLDEIRYWSDVRTQAEIQANMFKEINTDAENLAAYYKMNTGSGGTLIDYTSGGHNGYLNSNSYKVSGCFEGPGNALDFDGSNDYVILPTLNLSGSALTYEAWVYPNSFQAAWPYISTLGGIESGSNIAMLRFGDAGLDKSKPQFILYIGGGETKLDANSGLSTDKWHHIAAVYDGSEMKLYIDGILDASKNQSGSFTANEVMNISYSAGARYFDGQIDEFRVWNDARTETEIRDNMMNSLRGNEENLVAYYRFDESVGTVLYDLTDNAYNGALQNMDEADWVSSSAYNRWIGSDGADFSGIHNWSMGSAPGSSSNICIKNLTDASALSLSGSPTVNHLLLCSSSTFTLASGINVNGNIILENDLDLNGQTIVLGSSGMLVEHGGLISGTTGSITTTRTLNNINENVGGLGAAITTSANLGSTVITRTHNAVNSDGIKRRIQISPTNNSGLDATLVFHYDDSELNDVTESGLELFRSTDGVNWIQQTASEVDVDANTITLTGIDAFSAWTGGAGNSSMPVELTSFNAEVINHQVVLKWKTETEIENFGFDVERSQVSGDNGDDWEQAGFIPGAGNSNVPKEYSFTDSSPVPGKLKYRLMQIDNDGSFEYSEVIEVNIDIPLEYALGQNFPNPFNPSTTINYSIPENSYKNNPTVLKVFDILGSEVALLVNEIKAPGNYEVIFNADNLASGLYFYKLTSGKFTSVKKMVLLK